MKKTVSSIMKDIKNLRIQGARNVAKSVVEAVLMHVSNSKANTKEEMFSDLLVLMEKLSSLRPTEPMTRNIISDIISFAGNEMKKKETVKEMKEHIRKMSKSILKTMRANMEMLSANGEKLIKSGQTVLTHCHSSSVTSILKSAYDSGKDFKVICCETRPLYQGRITAKELARYGIKTSLIVDGAASSFIKKADIVLVGADAITSSGNLVNKVGTSAIAKMCFLHGTEFYSAAELYKFDSITLYGNRERLEHRDAKEVWERAPKSVGVENPAFDETDSKYISAYITEAGIIPPETVWIAYGDRYGKKG